MGGVEVQWILAFGEHYLDWLCLLVFPFEERREDLNKLD